ncbi:MAG: hypothetical protein D6748_10130 [Calditrichaeota bacterium]|nr:MAG: hypothetical protein D6748_10130 [Calditrichota bacterium]
MTDKKGTYFHWLMILTLVAFALRLVALGNGIWFDEIVTLIQSVRQDLWNIVQSYPSENRHMLYAILAHISTTVFGESVWALRLPAVIFGTLSIPALYWLGKSIANEKEAIWAAALLTFSYHHIWFSQNARGYTGLLFFAILSMNFFILGLKENRLSHWIFFSIATALGIYTHLTMVFVTASQGLIFLWLWARKEITPFSIDKDIVKNALLYGFILSGIFTLLLYSPALPDLLKHFIHSRPSQIASQWTNPLWTLMETIRGLQIGLGKMILGLIAGGFVFGLGMYRYFKENVYSLLLLLLPPFLGATIVVATNHNIWPRFFFFAFGYFLLITVRGAFEMGNVLSHFLPKKFTPTIISNFLLSCFLVMFLVALPRSYQPKQNFEGPIHFLKTHQGSKPVVTVGLTTYPYRQYYQQPWVEVQSTSQLDSLLSIHQEVWLVYTFPVYMESRHPELWQIIQERSEVIKRFPGTIGGGDIYLCKITDNTSQN